jgi:amino acid permease
MSRVPMLRLNTYNYRAAQNLSRSVSQELSTETRSKSWYERTFGKLRPGSMRVAIFSLLANSMETGCLSLPIVLKYVGIVPGISIIILSSIVSKESMDSLSTAAEYKGTYNYSKLVKKLLGEVMFKQNSSVFLDIILILYLFFSIAGYQLLLNESLISSVKYFDIDIRPAIFIIMIIYSLFIVFPMSLLEKITDYKIFSFISIGSILYICVTLLMDLPGYIANGFHALVFFKFDMYFFSACSFGLFAYNCHLNILLVFSDMRNPSKKRIKKVNFRVCAIQVFSYLIVAISGYLSLFDDTPLFITQRNGPGGSLGLYIIIGRVMVCLVLLSIMPVFLVLCRHSIQNLLIHAEFILLSKTS